MTNKEAIEVLEPDLLNIQKACYHNNYKQASIKRDALSLAITALREKAEKERRFVAIEAVFGSIWQVRDNTTGRFILEIPAKSPEAAQRIADIYEEMYK
jgi:hypothetical protein